MFMYLFDRIDRLGSNITNYIAQILLCHKRNIIIRFSKNKQNYRYYESIFVKILFNYIDLLNEHHIKIGIKNDYEYTIPNKKDDWINVCTVSLQKIKMDFITYFNIFIYDTIKSDLDYLHLNYSIPFDINKTILVHLRLDDVANKKDYNGLICSQYYKKRILNNNPCRVQFYRKINHQAPLSKIKLDNIIEEAKNDFCDYKIILLTSPRSDTSLYDYDVIKNDDENLDLFLLTMCSVVILSRSTFALSSLFFNNNKKKIYIPLWGHFVCTGLGTHYDKNKNKNKYFY
jgi:hypothetical protein